MKKIGLIMLVGWFMIGCQKVENREIDNTDIHIMSEYIEFEIVKSEVCEIILPLQKDSKSEGVILEHPHSVFVDVVLKTVNLSDMNMSVSGIYSGDFVVGEQRYQIQSIAENCEYNKLTNDEVIPPTESRYVHLYCEVPENQLDDKGTIELDVFQERKYNYTFTLNRTTKPKDQKVLGDILLLEQSQISLNHLSQSQRIEPSYKGLLYKYIPTDHDDEIFIILQIDLKNISETDIDPQKYIYCEYIQAEQIIPAKIIVESDNHQSLSQKEMIRSAQVRSLYLAIPIQESFKQENGTICLFVEGRTFEIAYPAS